MYGFRSQSDEAIDWLERACAKKASVLYAVEGELALKNLEADPR
jgi:hypothetical protein